MQRLDEVKKKLAAATWIHSMMLEQLLFIMASPILFLTLGTSLEMQ
jgi:hypothetical protein